MKNIEEVAQKKNLIEESRFNEHAFFTKDAIRLKEEPHEKFNVRPAFFRDADRILHSNAYSRYMDKTQVFPMVNNDMITHRGLHVQFVAKIARTIGRVMSLNEDLIEAMALGHDLGHVPFGHFGEKVLNDICEENNIGCFIHNAQSVRVLQSLERNGKGLNITLQVLDGILCHNGEILEKTYIPNYGKTKEQFLEEYENCWKIKGFDKTIKAMTLEGCVVRISDVIAYIGRDLEDAIVLNVIKREDIPAEVVKVLGNKNSTIIDKLVEDLLENSFGKDHLEFSEEVFVALKTLLEFNYKNIYNSPKKAVNEERSKELFRSLYKKYINDLKNKQGTIYNDFFLPMVDYYKDNTPIERVVVDFIAGMTDNYFVEQFENNFLPKVTDYN